MPRKLLLCMLLFLLGSNAASASNIALEKVANAAVVGQGRLSMAFWDVYDATLYAPNGRWQPEQPFALSIHYFREIDGDDVADRCAQEMRKQGFKDEIKLAAWHTQMQNIFPDVKNGDILTAVFNAKQETKFYAGSQLLGTIKGQEFAKWFSGIWLSERTSEPELRRQLLGLP